MQKSIIALLLLILIGACNETEKKTDNIQTETTVAKTETAKPAHVYYASYVGGFEAEKMDPAQNGTYSNLINITISTLEDGKATGRSIIAGNDRPFNGTYKQSGALFEVNAAEPGDDKHDGHFEFTLDTSKLILTGKWYSNDKTIAVPVRKFELNKKTFVYNADNNFDESIEGAALYTGNESDEGSHEAVTKKVIEINASKQKLSSKDVENLYKGDLELIRNAIYARHGYSFRNRKMRYIFDGLVDWYVPMNVDVRNDLTALEKENIDLLKRYENHAEKYYDEFSR